MFRSKILNYKKNIISISYVSSLIKGWPNTYTFTKAVAEELVRTMGKDLPLCVVRPSIGKCFFFYTLESKETE